MRIAIYGTGGAGGYFGARLAAAGEDVVFVARGEHLRAIRERGLRLTTPVDEVTVHPAVAVDDPSQAGTVDAILFGVKTWQLADAARAALPMLGPGTFVVPLQNGVDAPSILAAELGEARVLGGTCGTISRVTEPGVITSLGTVNFVKFGELDDRPSARTEALRAALERAGIQARIPPSIHTAMWEKFLFVVSMGGVGAVSRVPVGVTRAMPGTRAMLESSMREIHDVGRDHGIALPDDAVARAMVLIDGLAFDGTTSMQRDIEGGRRSELDAWCGAVVRLGRECGVATPVNEFCYASLLPQELRARGELTGFRDYQA